MAPFEIAYWLAPICLATGGGAPTLEASAPYLGSTWTLEVAGAPGDATVVLLYSPTEGEFELSAGTLELGPVGLTVVAAGTAAPDGALAFDFELPLKASWAEVEAHVQALVVDAGLPGGALLSAGVHARLLGSRVYAHIGGIELTAFSATAGSEVWVTEADGAGGSTVGDIVLTADGARGAYVTGGELRIFDNFFGEVLFESFPPVSSQVFADPDGESVWAHTNEGTLVRISMETGSVLESIAIQAPDSASWHWAVAPDLTEAYLEVRAGGRVSLRRVDLSTGAERSVTPLGEVEHSRLAALDVAGDWVLAVSEGGSIVWTPLGPVLSTMAVLTQLDFGTSTTLTRTTRSRDPDGMLVMPDAGAVLVWQNEFEGFAEYEPFVMERFPLGAAAPPVVVAAPTPAFGSGQSSFDDVVLTGPTEALFSRMCCKEPPFGDESGSMWYFDATTNAFGASPSSLHGQPTGLAVVDDGLTHQVYTSGSTFGLNLPFLALWEPDLSGATEHLLELHPGDPFHLQAVSVP